MLMLVLGNIQVQLVNRFELRKWYVFVKKIHTCLNA